MRNGVRLLSSREQAGRTRAWLGFFLLLFLIASAVPAVAEQSSFDVEVWTIRATKANSDISPELKGIARQLKAQFKFTGFKLVKKSPGKAAAGKTFTAALIGGYTAKVTPTKKDGKRVTFKIEVMQKVGRKDKPVLRTAVTIDAWKLQLWGGWTIDKRGDVLICGVRAK